MSSRPSPAFSTTDVKKKHIPFRFILAVIIAVFEVLAILTIVTLLCIYVPHFYTLCILTQIGCVIRIVASDDNPDYKVPWVLLVALVPVIGFMVYFLFYSRTLSKRYIKRLQDLEDHTYHLDHQELLNELRQEDAMAASQAAMLCEIADTHLFTNTKQTYFSLGEELFTSLLQDLKSAQHFIYMEYFIIQEGKFWDSILDVLRQKVAEGVEVKLVYDDIGCMMTLPGDYYKTLQSYGIEATLFSQLRGNANNEFNNRSHRKITVIDGKVGYTGGINLADEYINEIERFGHWKDTGIRLEGEAVWELTKLFLVDYGINVRKMPEIRPDLFPEQSSIVAEGYMIPFGDGPLPVYEHKIGKNVIQNLLSSATRYVYMTSPYLIIDNDLCSSIEVAALRGVDVKIIVPHIPDKKIVFGMTRSYYNRLLKAGVHIYEYEPGFIHAKSYIADDAYAMIGTINLDYRSLVHHFENGIWMYRTASVRDIKADIDATLEKCIQITPENLKTTLLQKVIRSVVRIIAPML